MRTRGVMLLAVGVLMGAACGDDARKGGAAPDTAPTESGAAATVAVNPVDTVDTVLDAVEATVSAATADSHATDATPDTQAAAPLGGVTIDDPLPAQADAATDPVVAEAAVRYAYEHWILVELDKDLRASIVENGEANADALADGLLQARSIVEFGRISVQTVTFTAADRAEVGFDVRWNDGPSPYFPDPMSGTAVLQNGTWRITGGTLCLLAFGAGQDCAGADKVHPVPAPALVLLGQPVGFTWSGEGAMRNAVMVPGVATWTHLDQSFTISTQVRAGVSALEPADAAAVLATRQFLPDGEAFPIGGLPGRLQDAGDAVQLVYIRPDDVVVSITAMGLTVEQVTKIAFALAATEPVPAT